LTFAACIGRVCVLTVLYNLNERKSSGRYGSSLGGSTSTAAGTSIPLDPRYGNRNPERGVSAAAGISVHQMSIVHVDGKRRNDDNSSDGEGYNPKQREQEIV